MKRILFECLNLLTNEMWEREWGVREIKWDIAWVKVIESVKERGWEECEREWKWEWEKEWERAFVRDRGEREKRGVGILHKNQNV